MFKLNFLILFPTCILCYIGVRIFLQTEYQICICKKIVSCFGDNASGADSRKGVPGVRPPPLKFSKIRVLGIYIHVKNDKYARISVSSYVTIINLPLISDFISYYADSEAAR